MSKDENNSYVWYVGYGSNLLRKRFLDYITGGQFELGGSCAKGCKDKTPPKEDRPTKIPYALFFSGHSKSWDGAVSFVSPTPNKKINTYGRMWKLTKEQYSEIKDQEGKSYDKEIYLGEDEDGIPIYTITNSSDYHIHKSSKPSVGYVTCIIAGLKETHHLSNEEIVKYLIKKPGIEEKFKEQDLMSICHSNLNFLFR